MWSQRGEKTGLNGRYRVENVDNKILIIHMKKSFIFRGSPDFDKNQIQRKKKISTFFTHDVDILWFWRFREQNKVDKFSSEFRFKKNLT